MSSRSVNKTNNTCAFLANRLVYQVNSSSTFGINNRFIYETFSSLTFATDRVAHRDRERIVFTTSAISGLINWAITCQDHRSSKV